MSGGVDHEQAPLFDTLREYARGGIYGFHTPAHKCGHFADADLAALVGSNGLVHDLPSMTATDNTFHPTGCLRDAQRLAAELVGARESFFLSAGSTLGVATALVAAVPPGATVALPRNIHRSVVAGLVLCGGRPRFIDHDVMAECGALGVAPEAVTAALDEEPRPAAVLLTRPTYYGLARDLAEVVTRCHERRVPVIVDEAHGAHFHFLPNDGPEPALSAGADLVVQSWHKTLGSLVGSAMLHVGRNSLVEPEQVRHALNLLQTTSPNNLLLASLDLVRRRMACEGRRLFADAVAAARQLEGQIDALPGLQVFRTDGEPRLAGHRRDPLRLVVNVSESGWTGYDVELLLRNEYKIEDEMSDWLSVVYILSPQDDPAARDRLLAGLKGVSQSPKKVSSNSKFTAADLAAMHQPAISPLAMLPRAAALAAKKTVLFAEAAGQICAEMVMFYPPGIPLLMPGETITEETIEVCRRLLAAGADAYASDPTLHTVHAVQEVGG